MAMDKKKVQKTIINVFVIIALMGVMFVAGRYMAGYLLIKTFHLNYSVEFDTYSNIARILADSTDKKTKFILNGALAFQIIMIILIPFAAIIAILGKIFKKESRYGDAKWATNKQLKDFEDQGCYRK